MLYLIYFVVDSYHKIHHWVICLANFFCHFSGGIFELEAWQTRQVRQYWTVPWIPKTRSIVQFSMQCKCIFQSFTCFVILECNRLGLGTSERCSGHRWMPRPVWSMIWYLKAPGIVDNKLTARSWCTLRLMAVASVKNHWNSGKSGKSQLTCDAARLGLGKAGLCRILGSSILARDMDDRVKGEQATRQLRYLTSQRFCSLGWKLLLCNL